MTYNHVTMNYIGYVAHVSLDARTVTTYVCAECCDRHAQKIKALIVILWPGAGPTAALCYYCQHRLPQWKEMAI